MLIGLWFCLVWMMFFSMLLIVLRCEGFVVRYIGREELLLVMKVFLVLRWYFMLLELCWLFGVCVFLNLWNICL